MSSYIVLDFETKDPNIDSRSWPCGECTPLGAALLSSDGKYKCYETNISKALEIVNQYDTIICHNLQYDCGILVMLGYDIYKHTLIDTKILAKLYQSNLMSTSLDVLGEKFLGERKELKELIKLAKELKSREKIKFSNYAKEADTNRAALKALYKNMDIAQEYGFEVIESYAIQDAVLTEKLYKFFMSETITNKTIEFYSDLLKCLIKARHRGVPVSIDNIEKASTYLLSKMEEHKAKAYKIAGKEFNFNASDDFYKTLIGLRIRVPESQETGKYTVTKAWMAAHPHSIFKEILAYKQYDKAHRDYVVKLKSFIHNDKLYPSFTPLGADTGRFTCKSPNIQQIPAREPEILDLCRGIFAAPEGKDWVSLDYSSQEPRLQVHYAALSNLPGASILEQKYKENPDMDLHQNVADICNISKKQAKTINLGLSYGMGLNKLSTFLGVDIDEAKRLKGIYNSKMPYLHYLMTKTEEVGKNRGSIRTLGNRHCLIDQEHPYKALNYLIQGSAADQTMRALVECYRAGIDVLFSVHDEINFLVDQGDTETVNKVKNIMENCYQLRVPVVASVKVGKTWAECK
jgi:DNA polymerase-1